MKRLDLTLGSASENVALDEALLEAAEAASTAATWVGSSTGADGILRFWEPSQPMVVVGRSSRTADEARLEECARINAAVVRRSSGGASIVSGPGCLMYALVLSYQEFPQLRSIDVAHRFVLAKMVAGLQSLAPAVACRGTSDLVSGDRKFSGNSVRCKRNHLLYHGTLLYDFDLSLVERLLKTPPRQPDYRAGRSHGQFICNLPATADQLRAAISAAWQADESIDAWPQAETARLVAEKYSRDVWNLEGSIP